MRKSYKCSIKKGNRIQLIPQLNIDPRLLHSTPSTQLKINALFSQNKHDMIIRRGVAACFPLSLNMHFPLTLPQPVY